QSASQSASRHTKRTNIQTARQRDRKRQRPRLWRLVRAFNCRGAVTIEYGATSQARGVRSPLRRRKHSDAQKFLRTREGILQVNAAVSVVHNAVKLIECPRDAWQGITRQIPTELKARYLRALIVAGFKHIDAVSFVSPKAVPQMADSEKVLKQVDLADDVEIIGIVVNEKGAERAIATKAVSTLGYPSSISETFLRKNQNQTIEQCYKMLEYVKRKADVAGLSVVAYISMAFGNPYGDRWDEKRVGEAVDRLV